MLSVTICRFGMTGRGELPRLHVLRLGGACRDGESHNLTWNCGVEGPSREGAIVRLRARQMRNLATALLVAQGIPMILMGDEYGHSKVCRAR